MLSTEGDSNPGARLAALESPLENPGKRSVFHGTQAASGLVGQRNRPFLRTLLGARSDALVCYNRAALS